MRTSVNSLGPCSRRCSGRVYSARENAFSKAISCGSPDRPGSLTTTSPPRHSLAADGQMKHAAETIYVRALARNPSYAEAHYELAPATCLRATPQLCLGTYIAPSRRRPRGRPAVLPRLVRTPRSASARKKLFPRNEESRRDLRRRSQDFAAQYATQGCCASSRRSPASSGTGSAPRKSAP